MINDTSQLLFWATTDPDAQGLARCLQRASAEQKKAALPDICQDTASARAALRENAETSLCVLYTAPDLHLGRVIERSDEGAVTLEKAAELWDKEVRAVLNLHRQNRQRCLLFESSHFRRYSETALARLGLQGGQNSSLDPDTIWDSLDLPVLTLVANTHLHNLPELRALNEELAASTQLLSNDETLTDTLPTIEALRSLQAQRMQRQESQSRHLDALQRLETELADKAAALKVLDNQNAATVTEKARLGAEIAALRSKMSETCGARDILLQQSKLMLAELREMTGENVRLTQDMEHRRAQVGALEAEIDRIMSSSSIRITGPLRYLGRLLGKKPDA